MRSEILREKQKSSGVSYKPRSKRQWKHTLKMLEWLVFLLAFVGLSVTLVGVYMAKSKGQTPAVFGVYMLFSVESGSMEPTLTVGSVIICKKTQQTKSLQAGQIVTFHTQSGAVVTHRIMEVTKDDNGDIAYRTKGDNPINSPDAELLAPERVIGVFAAKIPFT
jgi:signal peptidase